MCRLYLVSRGGALLGNAGDAEVCGTMLSSGDKGKEEHCEYTRKMELISATFR